jgi:hypothetical protein
MCVGIAFCSQKNCLEQERCVGFVPAIVPKSKKKQAADIKINLCQQNKKFCSNERVCEILGQCMLEHPAVKSSKQFTRELRKAKDIKAIVRMFERFVPENQWISNPKKHF